jgi:DNA-binding IclR family transcriptional regulator
MKGWNPHRLEAAERRRDVERSTVLSCLRRRDCTAKELARRAGLSMYQTRRAIRALQKGMLVTWLPQRKPSIRHAYTRVYLATSKRSRARKRARA